MKLLLLEMLLLSLIYKQILQKAISLFVNYQMKMMNITMLQR